MNLVRLRALGVLVGLGSAWICRADPPIVPEDIKATIRQRVDYGYAPAIIVGLLNADGPAYFAYGSTDRTGGHAVDEHTLFEIGSVTKVFTTTLLADFAERAELGLTNAIQDFLPEGILAPTRSGRAITLAHLASHTSGLPSFPDNIEITDGNNPFAGCTEQRMYEFLDTYTLTRNPGALYAYSNYGVGLLGQILARHAGTTYEALVVQWIADELGLADTRIDLNTGQLARLARGFSGVLPIPPFEMTALEAAGDLRSTARDLLAFLAANRGWQASRLQPAMTEAQQFRSASSTPGLNIALGWHLYVLNAGTVVFHDGATIGHRAFAGFVRNGATAAVVLSNSDYDVVDLGFHLLDPTVTLGTVRPPATIAESALRHYVGRYERVGEDHFTINLVQGRLTLQYSADMGRGLTLYPSGQNRFYLTFPEASATFSTNLSGQATSLLWTQSGVSTSYPKVRLPSRLAITRSNDIPSLSLFGDTDRDYVIQVSTNLIDWTDFSTNTIWNGLIPDPAAVNSDRRFYRVYEP